jgi:hypothetical protein
MRYRYLFILPLMLLLGCSTKENVDLSIQKGLIYLDSAYTDDHSYKDGYLEYLYPGETLECPLGNCTLSYRKLDAYFNLIFIERQIGDYSIIEEQVIYAKEVMQSVEPLWERDRIYNVVANATPGGYALDTYCIVGLITNSSVMAKNVRNHLLNNHWLPEDFYTGDEAFRRIADESWCIRLLYQQGEDEVYVRKLVSTQLKQADTILDGSYPPVAKVNTIIHILYLLNEVDSEKFQAEKTYYTELLVELATNKKIREDTLTTANILDVLIDSGYKDQSELNYLAALLVERQDPSGKWYPDLNENKDFAQVFTTFRCVIALDKYNKYEN